VTDLRSPVAGVADLGAERLRGAPRFNDLVQEVRQAGLLDSQPGYWISQILLSLLFLAAGGVAFFTLGDSWWQLAVAVYFGVCWTHLGFLGHDVSHRQVVRGRTQSRLLGLVVGNLALGFSYGGFVRHHMEHHAYPNHLDRDPDIARRRVILVPERPEAGPGPGRGRRFVLRHKKAFFYPGLVAESAALRMATYKAMRTRTRGAAAVELTLIAVHFLAYGAVVLAVLPASKAIPFVLIQQVLFGIYTESVVAPNHKAMPVQTPDNDWDWFQRQLVTSRNLRPSRLVSLVFGGQNYHIEHHLFPTMPRNNGRRAQPIVEAFCRRYDLPYHEVSVGQSFVELLGKVRRPTSPSFG
jgi:fatty acid desaturase